MIPGKVDRAAWPFHTRAKGCDHVIVRALDSHPKVIPLTWSARNCVRPTQIPVDHATLLYIVAHVRSP